MLDDLEKKWVRDVITMKFTRDNVLEKLNQTPMEEEKVLEYLNEYDNLTKKPDPKIPVPKKKKPGLWDKMFNKHNVKRADSVAIIYLRKNGMAQPLVLEPKDDMFNIDGKTYHQREDCSYLISKSKIPLAVIHEDGLIPEGNKEFYDIDVRRRCQEHQDYVIKAIRYAEVVKMGYDPRGQKKFNIKMAIGLVIIAIIAYAVMKGGFG